MQPAGNKYKEIMEQIPVSKFDLVMGYGMRGAKEPAASEFFRKAGMNAICKEETDFFNLKKLEKPTVVYFPFGYEVDRGDSKVRPLSEYVVKSIDLLEKSCPKGFFMMVEGAKIDHNGHANDGPGMLMELIEFDRVVGKALEFYKKHPKDTLIIVTADHNNRRTGCQWKRSEILCGCVGQYHKGVRTDGKRHPGHRREKNWRKRESP